MTAKDLSMLINYLNRNNLRLVKVKDNNNAIDYLIVKDPIRLPQKAMLQGLRWLSSVTFLKLHKTETKEKMFEHHYEMDYNRKTELSFIEMNDNNWSLVELLKWIDRNGFRYDPLKNNSLSLFEKAKLLAVVPRLNSYHTKYSKFLGMYDVIKPEILILDFILN